MTTTDILTEAATALRHRPGDTQLAALDHVLASLPGSGAPHLATQITAERELVAHRRADLVLLLAKLAEKDTERALAEHLRRAPYETFDEAVAAYQRAVEDTRVSITTYRGFATSSKAEVQAATAAADSLMQAVIAYRSEGRMAHAERLADSVRQSRDELEQLIRAAVCAAPARRASELAHHIGSAGGDQHNAPIHG